jgi:hypothetical protein
MGEDTKAEREIVEVATAEMREHVYGARSAVLDDNEVFVGEVTDEFMKARGRVLRARAEYLKVPMAGGGGASLDDSGLLGGDAADPADPNTSAPPANVRTLVSQFENLRAKHLMAGTRLADAQMEKLLLQYEVKAARVRRAERGRAGGGKGSSSGRSRRKARKCPTCGPLTEANLELQSVASRMRSEKRGARAHAESGNTQRLSAALLKSKYGYGEERARDNRDNSGRVSPGAESVSSTGSGREAEFVKRFLGKVTKSSGTLRGTLAMLNGGVEQQGGGGTSTTSRGGKSGGGSSSSGRSREAARPPRLTTSSPRRSRPASPTAASA